MCIRNVLSYYALSHHGVGNLHEASDVRALHIVDVAVLLLAVLHALLVWLLHERCNLLDTKTKLSGNLMADLG